MLRFLVIAATALLCGCSGPNTSLATLQLSNAQVPYPSNYQVEAARAVQDASADPGTVTVSEPAPLIGESAFGPQRWYVCLQGMPGEPKPARLPRVDEAIEQLFDRDGQADIYNVVLVFSGSGARPSQKTGYNSPLCRGLIYEPITAAPPIT